MILTCLHDQFDEIVCDTCLFFIFFQTGIAEEVSVHSKVGEVWLDNDNASIVRR